MTRNEQLPTTVREFIAAHTVRDADTAATYGPGHDGCHQGS